MALQSETLSYFRAVIDAGSIQAAARNIVIAPSALSRQIRLLETEVGVELFQRSPQGMVPTTAGLELYDFASRQSAETDDVLRRLRSGAGDEPAEFRIACVEGVLSTLLPRWLAYVRQRHEGVQFHVTAMGSADVASAVAAGEADAGYTFGRVSRADLRELAAMPMPIRLALPRDHPLATAETVALAQLADELCVIPDSHFGIRRELDRECARAGITLNVAYETNSLAFALHLVHASRLISFTTSSMAVATTHGPVLVALEEEGFNSSALALVGHTTGSSARASSIRRDLADLMRDEARHVRTTPPVAP